MNKQSKAAFVRQIPETVPAEEVVKRAQKSGLKIALNYVWNIRSEARRNKPKPFRYRASRPGTAKTKPRAAAARVARAPKTTATLRAQLLASRDGLTRKRARLDDAIQIIGKLIELLEEST